MIFNDVGVMMPDKKRRRRKKRYHTGIYVSIKTGQYCKYRSSWELLYLQWLDSHTMVKTFSYESIKIPYISNIRSGKIRHYYPDFLVEYNDGHVMLVEIKPSKRLIQTNIKKKLAAAEIWCQTNNVRLEVITEIELRLLGIL